MRQWLSMARSWRAKRNYSDQFIIVAWLHGSASSHFCARKAMVQWLELSLAEPEDPGSIPASPKSYLLSSGSRKKLIVCQSEIVRCQCTQIENKKVFTILCIYCNKAITIERSFIKFKSKRWLKVRCFFDGCVGFISSYVGSWWERSPTCAYQVSP